MLRLLDILDEELSSLETTLQKFEARFVGASVLIVYEGDPDRLDLALDRHDALKARTAPHAARDFTREGDESSDDDEEEEEEEDEESTTTSDDDSMDGQRSDARKARRCPPIVVRMIDFAHTWLVQGEGPDVGVLKGLDTLRGLVGLRKEEVGELITKGEVGFSEAI
jgi:1D-myo-inositol-tetrakisphosphate 5-kinase/inositol-polyphosphate multikinase